MAVRPFSPVRFGVQVGVILAASAVLWWLVLRTGLLGGYFGWMPVVPLFFLAMAVASAVLMRGVLRGNSLRMATYFTVLVLGRLVLDSGFIALGLFLWPTHRIAFVVVALYCYLVALLLTVRSLIKP